MSHAISPFKHTATTLLLAALVASTLLLAAPPVQAAVPTTSVLEGFLSSTGGGAVADGLYDVTFAIYNVQINGSAAWTEGPLKVEVKGGQFTHALGSSKALSAAVLDQLSAGWLGMKIGTDPELPRQRLRSVAYALLADTAKALACSGCITNIAIADKTIGAAKVGFNYADSATKGGPAKSAADLSCTNCVSVDELKIDKTLDLGGNALKAKAVAADTVTAGVFKGSGAELTGIKIPTGECPVKGQVVYGIDGDGKLKCVAAVALEALPADGIDEISNNLIHNQFENEDCTTKAVPIADNDPTGVDTFVTFGNYGLAQKLEVLIDLKNSDLKNLTIKLWDPNKVEYLLWKDSKPGTELKGNWPTTNATISGDLTTWVNKNPQGKWLLQVIDNAAHPKNADPDGEISKFCIKIKTLSNQKVEVKGDLLVGSEAVKKKLIVNGGVEITGGVQIGNDKAACSAAKTGTLRWTAAKGLEACDGASWVPAVGPPPIFQGGCVTNGTNAQGVWYNRCINRIGVNTAPEYWHTDSKSATASSDNTYGRLWIDRDGWYEIYSANYGHMRYMHHYIYVNSIAVAHQVSYTYTDHPRTMTVKKVVYIKKGDYIQIRLHAGGGSHYMWHASNDTLNGVTYSGHNWMTVKYLGPKS